MGGSEEKAEQEFVSRIKSCRLAVGVPMSQFVTLAKLQYENWDKAKKDC